MRCPLWVLAVIAVSACYKPSFESCAISCDSPGACPSGLTCDLAMHLCSTGGSCAPGDAGGSGSDGGAGGPDGGGGCWPFAVSNFDPCKLGSDTTLPTTTIDTDAPGCTTTAGGSDVCLYHVAAVDLKTGSLTVIGARPLIIVADGLVSVNVPIAFNGAGVTAGSGCTASSPSTTDSIGAGGGGGGHAQAGAGGGAVGSDGGGSGGATTGSDALEPLELGCPGADAGNATPSGGDGGGGGGALQITSKTTIAITSIITVNGAGGRAGFYDSGFMTTAGGGGGGAGGSILLEAHDATLGTDAQLCAIGGGGGAGVKDDGTIGSDGATAVPPAACQSPSGGGQPGAEGAGGAGGAGPLEAPGVGAAGQINFAGGGGGGGAGRITFHMVTSVELQPSTQVVPAPATR